MARSRNRIGFYRDRCTPPITQLGLAQALGIHVNTMQRWERDGVPTPADLLRLIAFFVQRGPLVNYEAAELFWQTSGREQFSLPNEIRALFARPNAAPIVAGLPAHSRMPLHRNPRFVGRAEELDRLQGLLRDPGSAAVIAGLGGMGKTQLAVEFVHRVGAVFPGGVFWLNCADPQLLAAEIAACGGPGALDLRADYHTLPLADQLRLVSAAWQQPVARLLVFDNCEDEALLQRWRPTIGGCRVLATSRRAQWTGLSQIQVVPLQPLHQVESVALLRTHCPDAALDTLGAIADLLGNLPLAVHLAGAFLERYRRAITEHEYLNELSQAPLLQHRSLHGLMPSPTNHAQTLESSFALSYSRLDVDSPVDAVARALLARAAHCAPGTPLTTNLLLATFERDLSKANDRLQVDDGLHRLFELGLLDAPFDNAVRIHRLLGAFVRTAQTDATAQSSVERTLLTIVQRLQDAGDVRAINELRPQLQAVADAALPRADWRTADLCAALGWHLAGQCDYTGAQTYLEHAYTIRRATLGEDHGDTASSVNLLALLAQFQGDYPTACLLYNKAITIWERALGADDPQTATGCNNLGYLLMVQGDYVRAQPYLERALLVRAKAFGEAHPDTARSLNNVGYLHYLRGEPALARTYLERALNIRERVLGDCNAATAQTANNLGDVLFALGDLAEAQRYHERALAAREAVFGPDHPDTAESLKNLGALWAARGEIEEAERYLRRALTICLAALGAAHIDTAYALEALGDFLYRQGQEQEGRECYQQALATFVALLEPGHQNIKRIHGLLAVAVG